MAEHSKLARKCPQCGEVKEFEARNTYCGKKCADDAKAGMPKIDMDKLLEYIKKALRANAHTKSELAAKFKVPEESVQETVDKLASFGYNVQARGTFGWRIAPDVEPGAKEALIVHPAENYNNKWYQFGVLGDNHSGSKHERPDVVNALYDRYEEEGITEVFHTGNMLEGEFRMNKHDIKIFGLTRQVDYFLETYPQKKGITTYFVCGDDHEGWYQQREGIEIGAYIESRAVSQGRNDLKYLGYVEADVLLKAQNGERIMRVCHPGGGASYALSYSAQKIVESYQGGEKPSILLYGHYHKYDVNYYREVFAVGTGCCVDQSIFMRKQKIQAHVGGLILRLQQAPGGEITRMQHEWFPFYDRGYYTKPRQFGDKPSVRLVR